MMALRWICGVFLIVSWELGILIAITMENIDTTNNCPRSCSCPLLHRADCRNLGLKLISADIFSASRNELRSLWLDNNNIGSLDQNVFEKLTKLRDLSLFHNSLKCLTGKTFEDLINLVILDLSNNNLQYLDSNLLKSCTKLKKLNLSSNKLKVLDVLLISPLRMIEQLQLSNNPFDCTNCILRGAVEWTKNKMKDTGATCTTPNSGTRWQDYEFLNCILSSGSLDPPNCVSAPEDSESGSNDLSKSIFSLPIILAMVFGIALFLVLLGLMIFCCVHKASKRVRTENEMVHYDDIAPYHYEIIQRSNLNNLRYISNTSSTHVPELPRRPKKEEAKCVSKTYDDIYVKGEITRSTSYIEPAFPENERKTTRMSSNEASSSDGNYKDFNVRPSASKIRTTDGNGNDKKSSDNAMLTQGTSKSNNVDYLTLRASNDVRDLTENKRKPEFVWNRESFWKL